MYVAATEDGRVKVGRSKQPWTRASDLSVASKTKHFLYCFFGVEHSLAKDVEAGAHKMLDGWRATACREYFYCGLDIARSALETSAEAFEAHVEPTAGWLCDDESLIAFLQPLPERDVERLLQADEGFDWTAALRRQVRPPPRRLWARSREEDARLETENRRLGRLLTRTELFVLLGWDTLYEPSPPKVIVDEAGRQQISR